MKLITAIVRPEKLEAIREGLEAYGVQGLTVSAASGYGRQRGYTEVYRGAEYNVDLLPKIRVEVLATDEQADDILDVIIASSNTGRAGDGKVWTMDVFEAVRVRTGERGVGTRSSCPAAAPDGGDTAALTQRAGCLKRHPARFVVSAAGPAAALRGRPPAAPYAGQPSGPGASGRIFLQRDMPGGPGLQHRRQDPPAVLGGVGPHREQRIAGQDALQHFTVGQEVGGAQLGLQRGPVQAQDIARAVHVDVELQGVRAETDPQLVGGVHAGESLRAGAAPAGRSPRPPCAWCPAPCRSAG